MSVSGIRVVEDFIKMVDEPLKAVLGSPRRLHDSKHTSKPIELWISMITWAGMRYPLE